MTIDERLAVYGSLAPGRSNHDQLAELKGHWKVGFLRARLEPEGTAATGGYPALYLDPLAEPIEVQLFLSADLPDHWRRLDRFEGPGYRRTAVRVTIGDEAIDAWVYSAAEL